MKLPVTCAMALGLVLLIVACAAPSVPPESSEQLAAKQLERGKYMTAIMGCGDCHTPMKMGPNGPEPDMARRFSGHPAEMAMPTPPSFGDSPWNGLSSATNTAFAGPWGISYARNITPDRETGLGTWTEEMFVAALKTGKSMGAGRPILPPMPWPAYASATDDDLKAVFAYLKTVPAIANLAPDSVPATP